MSSFTGWREKGVRFAFLSVYLDGQECPSWLSCERAVLDVRKAISHFSNRESRLAPGWRAQFRRRLIWLSPLVLGLAKQPIPSVYLAAQPTTSGRLPGPGFMKH